MDAGRIPHPSTIQPKSDFSISAFSAPDHNWLTCSCFEKSARLMPPEDRV
jgi:hypothetical protein